MKHKASPSFAMLCLAMLLTALVQPAQAGGATASLRLRGIVPPSVSVVAESDLLQTSDGQAAVRINKRSNSADGHKVLLADRRDRERLLSVTYAAESARSFRLALPRPASANGVEETFRLIVRSN